MGWQPAVFPEVQGRTLVQLQSRFAWGFIFVTGVLSPALALVYNYVEHSISGESWAFSSLWYAWTFSGREGPARRSKQKRRMAMEWNLLPYRYFMFWFNSFGKFEAPVFCVGGGKGRVGRKDAG